MQSVEGQSVATGVKGMLKRMILLKSTKIFSMEKVC